MDAAVAVDEADVEAAEVAAGGAVLAARDLPLLLVDLVYEVVDGLVLGEVQPHVPGVLVQLAAVDVGRLEDGALEVLPGREVVEEEARLEAYVLVGLFVVALAFDQQHALNNDEPMSCAQKLPSVPRLLLTMQSNVLLLMMYWWWWVGGGVGCSFSSLPTAEAVATRAFK